MRQAIRTSFPKKVVIRLKRNWKNILDGIMLTITLAGGSMLLGAMFWLWVFKVIDYQVY